MKFSTIVSERRDNYDTRSKYFKIKKEKWSFTRKLGEKVNVTRQTIPNWELNEISPNPEQLKLLSKKLNISIDELLENDVNNIIIEKLDDNKKTNKTTHKLLLTILVLVTVILLYIIVTFIGKFIANLGF